ncbi:MAG: hypothetical protein KDF60_03615 [Calditrichaeota bacterium]|nr:hypothetical protein [Calditrichota bacterium]
MKNLLINSIILLTLASFLTNCSDSSVDSHSDHADAVGMRIVSSGVTIVSYIRDSAVDGVIEAQAGESSGHMDVEFYDDENDSWFIPEEDHFTLLIEIGDTTIADYWQHEGEEGGFEFHILGKKAGNTQAVFTIIHDDHPDFVSKEIPLIVSDGSSI